jgi:iron complex outermembrane receptor protein
MANLTVSQSQQGTSQVVGLGTGGASFADLRGIGANKTLVLLNGRRLANNAFDSSAPDLNMIPFAALERVEVLRDGASALYGSDAVGGVINFITKKDFRGGTASVGIDSPQHPGGKSKSVNVGYGFGDLDTDGYNVFGVFDHQEQQSITGTQRDFNTRYAGGLSPTTSPANYFQEGKSGNPAAPNCTSSPNLIPGASGNTSCQMTTSSFVDYVPRSQRDSALVKATIKLNADHQLSLEALSTESTVRSQIAPVPYGGLRQNRTRPDGSLNPFYPGNPGAIVPNIVLDPLYAGPADENGVRHLPSGAKPGYINVKWRDLPNGPRADENINDQQRFVAALTGTVAGWDYDGALTYNENRVKENLKGYSDGGIITAGVRDGVINPFGDQTAAGTALINSAALDGTVRTAKGKTTGADLHASRELGDWVGAGRKAALAVGVQYSHEQFLSVAEHDYAAKVVASTGIDPDSHDEGSRNVYAAYAELNVPLMSTLDVTAAVRYDKYSDFGSSTNPKVGFRFQPAKTVLLRGSYSTGFRAPSLYEINSAQTYTNTSQRNDPVNCPGGNVIPGKSEAANCNQQFQALFGGNKNLNPETSKNATVGLMIEPIKDLNIGIDLWYIQLKHAIGSVSEDDVFDNPTLYASTYHRTGGGNLATDGSQCPDPTTCGYVDLRTQNLGGTNTNGVDLSLAYKLRAGGMGNFAFNSTSTYVHKYEYQNSENGAWHQNVNIFSGAGPVFRWQNTTSSNWTKGLLSAGLTGHFKTGYLDQDEETHVASYTTFDAFGSYTMPKGFGVTVGVRNLADRAPPLSFQTNVFQAGYDPRYTDPTGRTYYVRATYNF